MFFGMKLTVFQNGVDFEEYELLKAQNFFLKQIISAFLPADEETRSDLKKIN
ncbi:MAG: hypothetical protein CM15mP40_12760 [Alphaproteobacteria bacterium]|nr:MAG: hypothetical protein CM15mP40_12760 [Alphaproteobacteria bacterium]